MKPKFTVTTIPSPCKPARSRQMHAVVISTALGKFSIHACEDGSLAVDVATKATYLVAEVTARDACSLHIGVTNRKKRQ